MPLAKITSFSAITLNQGLNDVYLPQDGDPTIDIVAVAGLGAVPGKTWTSNENGVRVNWLQDKETMLPKRFPNARIMEFEYPSKYYGEGAVNQTLQKVAEALLSALNIKRKGCSTRPIIFIAHCLGGLVVEKAICVAKSRMDDYKSVFNSVAGVVFLATPFMGTRTEHKAAFVNDRLLKHIGKGSESDILALLEFKSPRLMELLDEFGRILNETHLTTYCFYEAQKSDLSSLVVSKKWSTKWAGLKEKIVTEESAILPGRKEMSAYLDRNHFNINQFTGAHDGAYVVVQDQLHKMINKARVFVKGRSQDAQRSLVPDDEFEKIKKQLHGFDEDATINQVKKSRPDMFQKGSKAPCSFLLDTPEWKHWLQPARDGPEALWIRGKKGQGKTLFAIDVIEKFKDQCSKETSEGQNFFAYGFCDGSKPDTSSAVNVLRVILRQLIVQKRDLARHFPKSGKSKDSSAHTVPMLVQQLLKVSNDPVVGTIYIVIDGIDSLSHDSGRDDLLSGISQLLRAKNEQKDINHDDHDNDNKSEVADPPPPMIKLLVLSNTLNDDVAKSFTDQPLIDLTEDRYKTLVDQGINEDFSQRIVEFSRRRKYGPPSEYIMKSYIKSKAQSEPAWVTLACGEIEASEIPKSEIRGHLEALPIGTPALFKKIMDRILDKGDAEIEVTKELFRCLLLAKCDLNIDELAVMAGFSDEERSDRVLLHNYVKECAPFVGLNPDDYTVKFAMPEIQELFQNHAEDILFPSESSKKFQHGLIALRCFDYILNNTNSTELISIDDNETYVGNSPDEEYETPEVEETDSNSDTVYYSGPMPIYYAQYHWLDHAKNAEIDMLNSLDLQSSFWELNSVVRENWWTAYTEIETEFDGLRGMSSLHLAAFFGFDALLDKLLEKGRKIELETEDSWGNRPIYWAARQNHEDTVKILLHAGAAVDGHRKEGLTALHGAAMKGHNRIVDKLLEHKADVNFYHDSRGSPLFQACDNGYNGIVDTLIKAGANANLGTNAHVTPLEGAIWSSQVELVRVILDRGVHAEYGSDKKFNWTPLWFASNYGYTDIVDLLLQRGANVNWSREGYGNSLSVASQRGSIETVRRLLRAGPNVDCQQEALKESVWGGSPEVVTLLLEHNPSLRREEAFIRACSKGDNKMIDILAGNHARIDQRALDESLYFASDNELLDTVNRLLSLRADPSAKGKTFGSALGAACSDGTYDIAKALVDKGADVNQVGGRYGTPLQAASSRGSIEIVRLLLSKGAQPNGRISGQFGTPLQAAADSGSKDIVKLLLDRGAEIDAVGGEYGTALLAAACCRQPEILKMLVERGADVNIVSKDVNCGEPALQVAAFGLAAEYVQLLLDHGAEVDKVDNTGFTPLMAASYMADISAVKMLLARNADVHLVDKDGDNALICAVRGGSSDICNHFIDKEVDLNCVNHEGSTPLMEAVQFENLDLCKLLIEHGAEVNKVTNHELGTALHQACFLENSDILQFFLEKDADINIRAGVWGTCLQASVLRASTEFVTEVLAAGADVNATGGKYQTALAAAAYAASEDAASLLLERGANANITGGYYGSALGSAAAKGWTNIIDKLLPRTSPAIVNEALGQAILYRRADTVNKLLENGAKINVNSGKFSTAARALDESFQPHSNTDDGPVFDGFSIWTDDAGDFQTKNETNEEVEQSKEEFFKSYYSSEFIATPTTTAPVAPKQVENVKLKARETTIKMLLAKASQNTKNIDASVAKVSGKKGLFEGSGGKVVSTLLDAAEDLFSHKANRSKQTNGDHADGTSRVPADGYNASYVSNQTDRDDDETTRASANRKAVAYGAAGLVTGAAAGYLGKNLANDGEDHPDQDYSVNDHSKQQDASFSQDYKPDNEQVHENQGKQRDTEDYDQSYEEHEAEGQGGEEQEEANYDEGYEGDGGDGGDEGNEGNQDGYNEDQGAGDYGEPQYDDEY